MASRTRILVVEDNTDLRRLYAIGLNQHGFEVRLAANGAEALDRIEQERPDVILLDLLMPVMSGWEMLEKVNPPGRDPIPVIVITGQLDQPLPDQPDSVVAWLSKPVTISELVAELHNRLEQPRRQA